MQGSERKKKYKKISEQLRRVGWLGSKQKHLGADRETADDSPQETTHGAGAHGQADAHAEAHDRRRTGDQREGRRRRRRVVRNDCGALAAVYSNPKRVSFLYLRARAFLKLRAGGSRTRTDTPREELLITRAAHRRRFRSAGPGQVSVLREGEPRGRPTD